MEIYYKTKISWYKYHRWCDQHCWKMAEDQGVKPLQIIYIYKKEIILPDVYLSGVDHQQQKEQIEGNKYEEY